MADGISRGLLGHLCDPWPGAIITMACVPLPLVLDTSEFCSLVETGYLWNFSFSEHPCTAAHLSPASSLALFSSRFSQCHRHWGALLAQLLSIFPSSLGFYPPLSIQKIRSIFCYHLFPKSEVAEATYFCLTHFTRFIWYIWPNQIPDYSSFPLN